MRMHGEDLGPRVSCLWKGFMKIAWKCIEHSRETERLLMLAHGFNTAGAPLSRAAMRNCAQVNREVCSASFAEVARCPSARARSPSSRVLPRRSQPTPDEYCGCTCARIRTYPGYHSCRLPPPVTASLSWAYGHLKPILQQTNMHAMQRGLSQMGACSAVFCICVPATSS